MATEVENLLRKIEIEKKKVQNWKKKKPVYLYIEKNVNKVEQAII